MKTRARKATRIAPKNGAYWSTLACALNAAWNLDASLVALKQALVLETEPEMFGWIVYMLEDWEDDDDDPESLRYVRNLVELFATKARDAALRQSIADAADLAGLSGR